MKITITRTVTLFYILFSALFLFANNAAAVTPGEKSIQLSGEFQASGGEATYSLPIHVSPGRAGHQPKLSFEYRSDSPNGDLGMGWSLGGVSNISRCGKNLLKDGRWGGVNFDGNDRYCLDGQRLIAVSGKDGGDLTEYRLEKNGYDKIVSFGRTGGSGPAYFKIWRKDGSVYEYGNSNDSRVELPGQAHVYKWALNKITDGSKNNHITFLYAENNGAGTHVLNQIQYAGGKVNFQYEDRSDKVSQYFYGSRLNRNIRLKSIHTYDRNDQLIGDYNLAYHYSAGTARSLVSQIEYCAGGECSTALKFNWAETGRVQLDGGRETGFYQPYFIDQNNDGVSTLYGRVSPMASTFRTSAQSQFKNPIAEPPYSPVDAGKVTSNVKSFALTGKPNALSVVLNQCQNGGDASYMARDGIYRSYCRCTDASCKGQNAGDFDGDGGDELISNYQVVDINGDGIDDKYILNDSGSFYAYIITGREKQLLYNTPSSPVKLFNNDGTTNVPESVNKLVSFVDINNDGYLDLVIYKGLDTSTEKPKLLLFVFDGVKYQEPIELNIQSGNSSPGTVVLRSSADDTTTGKKYDWSNIKFVDINNDGYPELYHEGKFYLNRFGTITSNVILTHDFKDSSFGDWNGDGWTDVVGYGSSGQVTAKLYYSTPAIQDKITSFHEYAIKYDVTYKPAVDRSVLTQSFYDANNIRNVTPRRYLVSQVLKQPKGYDSTRYAYYYVGAKSHRLGGGFLGFAQITEVENADVSTKTITDFEQLDLVKVGKTNRVRVYKNNHLISDTNYAYTRNDYRGYLTNYYQIYASTITQKQYGLSNQVVEKQQVTQRVLNRFGSLTDENVTITSGLEGAGSYTRHQRYEYLSSGVNQNYSIFDLTSTSQVDNISAILGRYKAGISSYCSPQGTIYFKPNDYVIILHGEVDTPLLLERYGEYFKYSVKSVANDLDGLTRYQGSLTQISAQEFLQSGATGCGSYSLMDVNGDGIPEISTSKSTNVQLLTESGNNYWQVGAITNTVSTLTDETSGLSRTTKQTFTYTVKGFIASQVTQGSEYESTGEASVSNGELHKSYQYDDWGNVTAESTGGTDLPQRTVTTQYDSEGLFVTASVNAMGQKTSIRYNGRGLLNQSVSPLKSRTTSYTYDVFGRVASETLPGVRNINQTVYQLGGQCPRDVPQTVSCVTTTAATGAKSIIQYDYAGREVRNLHLGFQGRWIAVDTTWDRNGRKLKVTRPHFLSDTNPPVVTFGYDLLNREVLKSEPADGGKRAVYQTIYQGLKTTVTDARGYQHSTQSDVMGYILRKDEPLGAYQTYDYYPDGSLRASQDSKGNVTSIRYDSLGHRTFLDDPDMGKWSYRYNALGELVYKQDAYGVVTQIVYDRLGRKVKQTEGGAVSNWRYDERGAVGVIAGFSGNGNETDYYYNQAGLVEEIAVRVKGEKFSTHYFYDDYERVSREVRPNGTDTSVWGKANSVSESSNAQERLAVEYVYNQYGYVSAVRSPRSYADEVFTSASFREDIRQLLDEAIAQAGVYLNKAERYATQTSFFKEKASEYNQKTVNVHTLDSASAALLAGGYRYKQWCNSNGECYLRPGTWVLLHDDVSIPLDITLDGAIYRLTTTLAGSGGGVRRYDTSVNPVSADEFNSQSLTAAHDYLLTDYDGNGQPDLMSTQDIYIAQADAETREELHFTADELDEAAVIAGRRYKFYTHLASQLIALSEKVADMSGLYCEYANQLGGSQVDTALRSRCRNTGTTSQADHLNLILTQSELDESTDNPAYIYYWQRRDTDAYDHTLSETLGNGLANTYIHDPNTGRPSMITTHKASVLFNRQLAGSLNSGQVIRSLLYRYDQHNNVVYRQDEQLGITDQWSYDGLDRVTSNTIALDNPNRHGKDNPDFATSFSYRYDSLGNITYKQGIGAYEYDGKAAGPHAVTQANGLNYAYDSAGNMLRAWASGSSDNERTLSWNAFNKPETITRNGNTVTFKYDAEHNRYLKSSSDGKETFYFGKYYERVTDTNTGEVQHKHFIYADGKLIALNTQLKDADDKLKDKQVRYLHYDALESVDMITDGYGVIVERRSYDTWGKQRKVSWREDGPLDVVQAAITNRGYTGHEEITEVGLIHMNGRVYDQELGRFISPDPEIQAPFVTNSFNRYSYVWNNPLKYVDPTGFETEEQSGTEASSDQNSEGTGADADNGKDSDTTTAKHGDGNKSGDSKSKSDKVSSPESAETSNSPTTDEPTLSVEPQPEEEKSWLSKAVDVIHSVLDVAGQVPGIGDIADVINAGLYALQGDFVNAGISVAAVVPAIGNAATAGRLSTKVAGRIDVPHPSKKAARRAAERQAGMGKHGGREQLPDKPSRPGSRSPQGDPGVRTEVRSTDTGRTVHHDPYGHKKDNVPPHYGVDTPGSTTHHTYPSTHNPQNNR
ncbi:RHS repeat-associated core domain-containing protein [Vibrio mangrovi]|nr:RHS repeat-associated core domain-containing protein [Vibrio mangrovi]MDW6002749.1 RHS repeat-associated core domain-containing protein [Vibrio mangrovi]